MSGQFGGHLNHVLCPLVQVAGCLGALSIVLVFATLLAT